MEAIIKRKVDRLGRIVLPKEICRLNEIKEGTLLSVERDDLGNII